MNDEKATHLLSAPEINALAAKWAEDNGWSLGQALEMVMWQEVAKGMTRGMILGQQAKPKTRKAQDG